MNKKQKSMDDSIYHHGDLRGHGRRGPHLIFIYEDGQAISKLQDSSCISYRI